MDKLVIGAVAGSGKTTYIIDSINENHRTLILTYTTENQRNIKEAIISKYGRIPSTILVMGWFSFLYTYCLRPYYLTREIENMTRRDSAPRYESKNQLGTVTRDDKLIVFQDKISIKLLQSNDHIFVANNFFDVIYVDEVQDIYGYDLDLLQSFEKSMCKVCLVGDYFQHTYKSSQFKNYGSKPFKNYDTYYKSFSDAGFYIELNNLNVSHRVSEEVSNFIENNLKIEIKSAGSNKGKLIILDDISTITELISNDKIVKLFYEESSSYEMKAENWGNCKGATYENCMIILNKEISGIFIDESFSKLEKINSLTKSKFYVALTRSSNDTYIVTNEDFTLAYSSFIKS